MFTVELDYVLRFVPPMTEYSGGIVFTRTFELPFPPFENLHVFAHAFEDWPYPPGLKLEHICWDLDRGCFLATAELIVNGPIAEIPGWLASMRERGWKPGSYEDRYHTDDEADEGDVSAAADDDESDSAGQSLDQLEKLERVPPRRRPKEFNQLVKALVRAMIDAGDSPAAAYALDKTGLVYTEKEASQSVDDGARGWIRAFREYDTINSDDWRAWRRKVKRYKNIQRIGPFDL